MISELFLRREPGGTIQTQIANNRDEKGFSSMKKKTLAVALIRLQNFLNKRYKPIHVCPFTLMIKRQTVTSFVTLSGKLR